MLRSDKSSEHGIIKDSSSKDIVDCSNLGKKIHVMTARFPTLFKTLWSSKGKNVSSRLHMDVQSDLFCKTVCV